MKRIFTVATTVVLSLVIAVSVFANSGFEKISAYVDNDFKVSLNGKEVTLKNRAINYNDSSYLPLRELADLLDVEVKWDSKTKTATLIPKSDNNQSDGAKNDETTVGDANLNNNIYFEKLDVYNAVKKKYPDDFNKYDFYVDIRRNNKYVMNNSKEFLLSDTDYFYDRDTDKSYISKSIFLQFFSEEDLTGLTQYQIDFASEKVTKK